MYRLNLPSFEIKVAGSRDKPTVWDTLRRKYVALTPEEWVRQHFVHYLIDQKHFPQTLLANEVNLQIGGKHLRADSVLYDNTLKPKMIVEYKAPTVRLTQKVFDQIAVYNLLLRVDYLVVSNGVESYCCKMDYERQSYLFLEDVPDYGSI